MAVKIVQLLFLVSAFFFFFFFFLLFVCLDFSTVCIYTLFVHFSVRRFGPCTWLGTMRHIKINLKNAHH